MIITVPEKRVSLLTEGPNRPLAQHGGTAALKKKINPTRVPIEEKESIRWLENMKQSTAFFDDPGRCIQIGERESDIYELFHK